MGTKSMRLVFLALIVLSAAEGLSGQQTANPQASQVPLASPKYPWSADDVVFQELASEFLISPDSKWTVWVKSTADKEKDERVSNLFLSSLTEKKEVELTRGANTVSQPRWSPSGETIAFLSNRPLPKPKPDIAPIQIWLLSVSGGEPWPATDFERPVQHFEWLNDDTILFSAEEQPSLFEHETKDRKDDSDVVDDAAHKAPVRLFKLSVKDKKVTRVTDNDDWILDFKVSHDKTKAVAVARRELSFAWDQKTPPATYIVDLAGGKRTQIFTDTRIQPDDFEWTLDNSGFYVVAPYSTDKQFLTATVKKVYFYDLGSATTAEVNLDWDRSLDGSLHATKDGFIALLADGVYTKPVRYTRHGCHLVTQIDYRRYS